MFLDNKESSLQEMQSLDIMRAQCYDPNEERRIRNVVVSLGVARFNMNVRAVGQRLFAAK